MLSGLEVTVQAQLEGTCFPCTYNNIYQIKMR